MRALFINHPAEVAAQQPAGRALRLRAARIAQGETLDEVYGTEGAGISPGSDLLDPEFQRLMALYATPKKNKRKYQRRRDRYEKDGFRKAA